MHSFDDARTEDLQRIMFTLIGKYMSNLFGQVGGAAQMVRSSLFWLTHSRFEFGQAVEQSVTIGVESLGVTALTSLFTGMVLALQAGNTKIGRASCRERV